VPIQHLSALQTYDILNLGSGPVFGPGNQYTRSIKQASHMAAMHCGTCPCMSLQHLKREILRLPYDSIYGPTRRRRHQLDPNRSVRLKQAHTDPKTFVGRGCFGWLFPCPGPISLHWVGTVIHLFTPASYQPPSPSGDMFEINNRITLPWHHSLSSSRKPTCFTPVW
jgi:hypothetical protein